MNKNIKTMWNNRFGHETYIYGTEPNDFLKQHANRIKAKADILSIAEGEGRNACYLASLGHQVKAFDLSEAGKDKAIKLADKMGVKIDYQIFDMNRYDFGNHRFDAIISIFAHTDATTRHAVWQKIKTSLRPNGLFFLEAYHPKQIEDGYKTGGPPSADMMVSLDEIKSHFADFKCLHQYQGERIVIEGSHHTGLAFTTQFIAQKP